MGDSARRGYVEHPLVEPESIERRGYQRQLADSALGAHTLVCLPTGLGKTAVSLLVTAERLDEHGGRALLLAPTKPLVAQHADDFRRWLRLDDDEVVVFTGEVSPGDRAALWEGARVVIATPQVVENDLIGGRISLEDVVHCTFDECHRATGDYAYTYIAERYHADAARPLVTGLSASPGGDTERIRTVCENLGIDAVEVMTDADADVGEFTYATEVEWVTVELPEEVVAIRDTLNEVIADRLGRLKELGVDAPTRPDLPQRELNRLRGALQRLIDNGRSAGYQGMSLHAEVMKLRQAVSLVETQSVEALRRYFERRRNAARSSGASKADQRLVTDDRVREAMRAAEAHDDLHPKYRRARMLIAETLGIDDGSRVIVFTESRDTAESLTAFLGEHFGTRRFVGQGDREGSDGMTQAEQAEALEAFRAGEFEVLVSTSVAEEGLDVPEVDLVLFYEPVPTAIRSIQRKGRTGRQTEGRVVVLIAEDTRDEAFFWKSRRDEDRMRDELRALKEVAPDVEAELGGGRQSSVDAFEGPAQTDGGPAVAAGGPGRGQVGLTDFAAADGPGDDAAAPAPDTGGEAVEIVVDQRELDAAIARDLSTRDGLEVRLETLDVGDYVCSDRVVVERKTVDDFLATLTGGDDRSLFEQARDMARYYERPVLVVEGTSSLAERRDVHPNAIRGALAAVAVDFGVSVLRTADAADTAGLLAVLAGREQRSGRRPVSAHGEKTAKTLAEQQEYVVSSIAEVGPVTARSLLEAFGTVEAALTASAEELRTVKGVGELTAERIRGVVTSEYDPS